MLGKRRGRAALREHRRRPDRPRAVRRRVDVVVAAAAVVVTASTSSKRITISTASTANSTSSTGGTTTAFTGAGAGAQSPVQQDRRGAAGDVSLAAAATGACGGDTGEREQELELE